MTDKELINKIRGFRDVKPSKNWVLLAKKRIFDEEPIIAPRYEKKTDRERASVSLSNLFEEIKIIFSHKFAFASILSLLLLFGVFAFAQNSLPGNFLFPLKRVVENSQAVFVSQNEQSNYDIGIAQKRLKELVEVAQKNSVKNLAPAINEYQASISKVADNLYRAKDEKNIKEIVAKIQELKKQELGIKSLSDVVVPTNNSWDIASAQVLINMLEPFVEDLKSRSLTDEQKEALERVENYLQERDYDEALMELLSPPLNISR